MSILNKIKIHPLTYIFLILTTITGKFRITVALFIILVIHEIGHIIISQIFKWKITRIDFYPFGGNIKYDIKLNESPLKEIIVTLAGPILQIIGTIIITNLTFLSKKEIIELNNISYSLILFNLLPIVPLDGSKLVFIIANKFSSYKKSHLITIYLSIILIILLMIKNYVNTTTQLIGFFLIYKTYEQLKYHKIIINRFLLERYLYKINRGQTKIINSTDPKRIWRYKNNIFIHNNRYLTEKEILSKYFQENY